jgi:hypothetical protein
MKKIFYVEIFAALVLVACNEQKRNVAKIQPVEEQNENDTTIYGVCGENTAMHTIELINGDGDTLQFMLNDEDAEPASEVEGGLLAGDRLAVVATKIDGENIATKVINLTTLQGKWTSVDKNFEIMEDGEVKSNVKAEANPWTSWRILNGRLLLNKDTFDINELGADSMYLENGKGIFVYKRVK